MKRTFALAFALCALPGPAWAQVPARAEFRANTYTTAAQYGRAVALSARGDFVVAWHSDGQDGSGYGVFAQRFDATGAPRGAEFRVSVATSGAQWLPSVANDGRNGFVIAFMSPDGDGAGVFARRFDGSGTPRGPEFRVNTYTTYHQELPSIASDPLGNFVVVWESTQQVASGRDIFAQRYDAAGTPRGGEFRVNSHTTESQFSAAVASAAGGGFAVVWTSDGQDGSGRGAFGQLFDGAGAPTGAEFQANTYTTQYQAAPAVAAGAAGGFVVVWHSYAPQDGSSSGIFGQRFASSGARLGGEFHVNAYTTGVQRDPKVAADQGGAFVVAWTSFSFAASGYDVQARRFEAAAVPRGSEFRVNTYTTAEQFLPAVASDDSGNFAVSWAALGQDGSGFGVFAQRFGGLVPAVLSVDPAAGSGSDGNGVLEPGETVEVGPSWWNVNGAAQAFSGTLGGLAGPPGATYTVTDASGSYGSVPDGVTAPCLDCYGVSVSDPPARPATHWDASALEAITPDAQGQRKTWRLHVGRSFTDVPASSPFYRFVETLLHHGVTGGCTVAAYCPASPTTREQMAVFAVAAKEGPGYLPPACTPPNVFDDVPETSPFCRFIEELASRGVVGGCGGSNYCPGDPVTREQMAVFVLRTLDPALSPPACGTPMFNDVPASSAFCRWIEELARRGVVTGCGGGSYCPTQAVTREQMGVFIGVTFGLTLYGP